MSQSLTIELSDATYEAIERQAEKTGDSPSRFAAIALERQFQKNGLPVSTGNTPRIRAVSGSLEELFGSVDVGYPIGSDNEQIDADLAREYGDPHEPG